MRKLFLLSLISSVIIGCKKETPKLNSQKSENKTIVAQQVTKQKTEKLKLETFGFPEEVEGCSCYFAENRQEFVKQNYLYVDDYQKNTYLKINGKQVKISFDKTAKEPNMKNLNIQVKNDDYTITLKAKPVDEGEIETNLYKGTLTVEDRNGQKTETPVYGECGC